jgi:hypothetical protein
MFQDLTPIPSNETYYFVIRNALELIARRHDSEQGY